MMTSINENYQVTIPTELASALGLEPGMQLDWTIASDGTLIVTPLPKRAQVAERLKGAGRKYLRAGDDPVRDLITEREREDKPEETDT